MFGFKNALVMVENLGIIRTNLQIKDGKFYSFNDDKTLKTIRDDLIIVPGFIDEHMHGANGSDVMYGTQEALENISKSIVQDGVTSFLATTMTMSESEITKALRNIGNCFNSGLNGANLLGAHLEGPFISQKYCGAQSPLNIKKPSVLLMDKFYKASKQKIKMVTFAYEEAEDDFVNYLKQHNIVASIGHSDCSSACLQEGIKQGISCSTHTYNAMRGIHHRDVGIVGEVMIKENIYAEIICDLHHVSAEAIKLLYKCKGKDKIVLITDSMEARYLPDGEYSLGGQSVCVSKGTARLKNGTLAGSILKMNEAIRNIRKVLNISFAEAIDMATINPAKNLNIDDKKGSIKLNKDADFVIVDEDYNVYATFVGGKQVYKGGNYEI